MNQTFEEFLEEVFLNEYTGVKDDAEDAIDRWLSNLDGSEYIEYADEFAEKMYKQGKNEVTSIGRDIN